MFTSVLFTVFSSFKSSIVNFKSSIIGIVIICCIGYGSYYVLKLKINITNLELEKKALIEKETNYIKTIAIKEAKLSISESLNDKLNHEIKIQNEEMEDIKLDTVKLNEEVIKLQHQEPSIKYIPKSKVVTCDDLNKMVKTISEIKYDEL